MVILYVGVILWVKGVKEDPSLPKGAYSFREDTKIGFLEIAKYIYYYGCKVREDSRSNSCT